MSTNGRASDSSLMDHSQRSLQPAACSLQPGVGCPTGPTYLITSDQCIHAFMRSLAHGPLRIWHDGVTGLTSQARPGSCSGPSGPQRRRTSALQHGSTAGRRVICMVSAGHMTALHATLQGSRVPAVWALWQDHSTTVRPLRPIDQVSDVIVSGRGAGLPGRPGRVPDNVRPRDLGRSGARKQLQRRSRGQWCSPARPCQSSTAPGL